MGCLYRIDFPSGKSYIGITMKTAEHRFAKGHCKKKNGPSALGAAIRKYGAESASVQTLVIADDWKYLCDLEKKAIVAFNTKSPYGYNMTEGGDGVVDPSDEIRKIKSEKHIAYFSDPAVRAAHSAIKRKHGADPEVRKRMSIAGKKRFSDPEVRERNKEAQRIAHSSSEMREMHRANTLAYNAAHPERVEQHKVKLKEYYSDQHKREIQAERMREFYQTDAGKLAIENMANKNRGRKASPETRAKMRASHSKRKVA